MRQQREPVARGQAPPGERGGRPVDDRVELGEGQADVAVDERGAGRDPAGRAARQVAEGVRAGGGDERVQVSGGVGHAAERATAGSRGGSTGTRGTAVGQTPAVTEDAGTQDGPDVRRVLVLRALGLGDLLTAVPALRGLRRAHPQARLELAAPAWLEPVARLTGTVDRFLPVGPLAPLPPEAAGADLAVNLHGRGPQSTDLLRASGPRELVAYGVTSTWREDEREVDRWCRLLREAGIASDPGELDLPVPDERPLVRGAVLVHPGSAAPARRWPPHRWAAVVRGLPGRVLVTAGPGEEQRAREIAAMGGLPGHAVVAGLALPALTALVAASRLLLASDTGVAHLATAVRTPSVVVFGPVPPAQWGPPPDRPLHVALGGARRSDPTAPDPAPALLAVTPEQVLAAARGLLARSG